MEIAIIGGGAAGFFAAIAAKEKHPAARVVIFEKSKKVLAKVKISGGGRCNVTNRYLLEKSALPAERKWGEVGKKGLNKLVSVLTNDEYAVQGKASFKEELVTCGGVSLDSIDCSTMQSRVCPSLYFAGEILDIDGITGGYNFQSAWTTGFIAGQLQ